MLINSLLSYSESSKADSVLWLENSSFFIILSDDKKVLNKRMIDIKEANSRDFPVIRDIAHRTWPHTFGSILSPEQIAYMLEWMYSLPSLQEQLEKKGHRFLLAKAEDQVLGFASLEHNYKQEKLTKIHKLYVLPNTHGKGIGKALINRIKELAVEKSNTVLTLNVNRYNAAVNFYQHLGFRIVGEENISIGEGFLMEDYIMEKAL